MAHISVTRATNTIIIECGFLYLPPIPVIGTIRVSRRFAIRPMGATAAMGAIPIIGEAKSTLRLPILKSADGVVKEKRVSEAWNDHKLLARQVRSHVAEKFLPRDGVKEVGIVGGDGGIDGQQRLAVEVDITEDVTASTIPPKYRWNISSDTGGTGKREGLL